MHKVLVVSDLHGSNSCFRSLIFEVRERQPDFVLVAGDWSGKKTIPFNVHSDGSATYHYRQKDRTASPSNISTVMSDLSNKGFYPIEIKDGKSSRSYDECVQSRLNSWLEKIDNLKNEGIHTKFVAIGGNDDAERVVAQLKSATSIACVDGSVVRTDEFTFVGLGFSNITPFDTPRELSEQELETRLFALGDSTRDSRHLIALIHVPPKFTRLDFDHSASPSIHIGSIASRKFVEKYQPLLVASGHCHSGQGVEKIGKSLCVNPGSTFEKGLLQSYFITLDRTGVTEVSLLLS